MVIQMIGDLAVLGAGLKLLLGAVQLSLKRHSTDGHDETDHRFAGPARQARIPDRARRRDRVTRQTQLTMAIRTTCGSSRRHLRQLEGTLFFSHVTDAGFSLVREYFAMSVSETTKAGPGWRRSPRSWVWVASSR